MRIIIIRHAEPDYENNTITFKGFEEASALADRLIDEKIDYIYCSPLGRAKDTIKEYVERSNKEYETCDWLREFDALIECNDGKNKRISWDFPVPEITSHLEMYDNNSYLSSSIFDNSDVIERYHDVINNFDKILEKHGYKREQKYYRVTNSNKKTLVFVCHLGLESVLLSHLFSIPYPLIAQHIGLVPSSMTIIYTEERIPTIAQFRAQVIGDYSHLSKKGLEPSFMGRFRENSFDDTRF